MIKREKNKCIINSASLLYLIRLKRNKYSLMETAKLSPEITLSPKEREYYEYLYAAVATNEPEGKVPLGTKFVR